MTGPASGTGERRARRATRQRLAFVFAAFVLGCVLAGVLLEAGLRFFNPLSVIERAGWHFLLWEGLRPSANPEKVWEHVPSYDRTLMGRRVGMNALGLRGGEIESPKPQGRWRALALGDSMTFGMSVDQDDCYPAQLQEILRQRHPGRDIEVINAGVLGYTTLQEEALLRELLPAVRPDVVVVWWFHNDVALTGAANPASQEEQLRTLIGVKPRTVFRRLLHAAYELAPCTMALTRALTIGRHQFDESHFQFDPQSNPQGWAANRESLIRIIHLCQEAGAAAFVYTFGRYEQIGGICREEGATYVTSVERAGREHEEQYSISVFDPHFTRKGNAVVAQTIAEAVARWPRATRGNEGTGG